MKLRTIDVMILLLIGLLCVARATWGIIKDLNVDLSTSKTVTGQVVYADITQIEEMTFKIKKHKTVFAIRLKNSDEKFAIDRGSKVCNYLRTELKTGDIVRLNYRDATSEYNTFVFQVQKDDRVLANLDDYKKRNGKMIALLYVCGFVILGGLSGWYINKRGQHRRDRTIV